MKLCILNCANHSVYAISVESKNGGTRVTPNKCCGSWHTVREFKLSPAAWDGLSKAAESAARRGRAARKIEAQGDAEAIECVAALLYEEETGDPWTVAGVEHPGVDRAYYRELARKIVAAVVADTGTAEAIVRESDAQVPVAATLDDAAADPALTLDVARELLRDAAAGIRQLAASAKATGEQR